MLFVLNVRTNKIVGFLLSKDDDSDSERLWLDIALPVGFSILPHNKIYSLRQFYNCSDILFEEIMRMIYKT